LPRLLLLPRHVNINSTPPLEQMAKFVNISGKVYVDTVDYGMISVSDYNDASKLATIPKQPAIRSTEDLLPLQNEGPEMTKEEVLRIATSYIAKYKDISYDISIGSKYHDVRDFLLQGLNDAFPSYTWYMKGRNDKHFVYRGDMRM
jgi:hypothetical protein